MGLYVKRTIIYGPKLEEILCFQAIDTHVSHISRPLHTSFDKGGMKLPVIRYHTVTIVVSPSSFTKNINIFQW